ncbi:MAG: tetratricopeptide repeat protein [Deltaproteobacteria bacterium]|nr:MAG: tetratricopeptide repeat protein [Deltaproteobacteria bacterium]
MLLGDLDGARANFEAILAVRPDDRDATGGLAEALARKGAKGPAEAAMRSWLGDRDAPPETFLVLRSDDFLTRLTSEPEE